MKYEFTVYPMEVEGHSFWVAASKILKGCVGQGASAEEAISELAENEVIWLQTAEQLGIPIPMPSVRNETSYSGKLTLRVSTFVHEQASENARSAGVSLNQYLNDAVVHYNAKFEHATKRHASSSTVVKKEIYTDRITSTKVNAPIYHLEEYRNTREEM